MVSKFDVFYVVALKGSAKTNDILKSLNKDKEDYQNIFNNILELEKEKYLKRDKGLAKILHNKKAKDLFELICFCNQNKINYNLVFKKKFLTFLKYAAKKETFTNKDIKVHPQTYKLYTDALSKYGLLLTISKKPLECKLLRHHFFNDLMKFFTFSFKFYKPKEYNYLKSIKKELHKYKRNVKIQPHLLREIEKQEEAQFIHTSLALEGNPMTLPDTQKLVLNKVIPKKYKLEHIQEVTNYKKAIDAMIRNAKKKKPLTMPLILNYHKLAMYHTDHAGTIREQNVKILKNPLFKTTHHKNIKKTFDHLISTYNKFTSKKIKDIINFASFFHNEFQRMHPFIDGNSRTSRLLMLHILRSEGFPILDLPLGYFDLYLDLTKRSKKRDDKSFSHLIEEILFYNLKKVNEKFKG